MRKSCSFYSFSVWEEFLKVPEIVIIRVGDNNVIRLDIYQYINFGGGPISGVNISSLYFHETEK